MADPVAPSALQCLSFLARASDEEVRKLASIATWANYTAGTVLFREGDKVDRIWIVITGKIAIEILGAEHRLHHVQTISDGEILAWSPFLGMGPMTAAAKALTDVHSVALDVVALNSLCESDPRFGYQFMRRVAAAIASRLHSMRLEVSKYYQYVAPISHL